MGQQKVSGPIEDVKATFDAAPNPHCRASSSWRPTNQVRTATGVPYLFHWDGVECPCWAEPEMGRRGTVTSGYPKSIRMLDRPLQSPKASCIMTLS
jgi:hypothetical protein